MNKAVTSLLVLNLLRIILDKQEKDMPEEYKPSETEASRTAVYSSTKTSFIKKVLNRYKKGSKRRRWWIIGTIVLITLIVLSAVVITLYATQYAIVDGQVISRSEYNDMQSKLEQFYKYNNSDDVEDSAKQAADDRLIEEKIIETEAERRGITASDEEIDARYKKIISQYSSEAEYIKTIKTAYNWTPELTKQTIKTDILIEKLKKVVIKSYDVSYIFVRYDMISATEDPAALPSIQKIYNRLKSGESWNAVYAEYEKQSPKYTSFGKYEDLNSSSEVFAGSENWQAITKLKKVGDITEITKTEAGYYVIYHADRITDGEFNTWEEFISHYKNKISYGGLINQLLGSIDKFIWQEAAAIGICDADLCPRGGSSSTPYHPMIYAGDVRDANTGALLGGVDVRLHTNANHNYTRQCNGVQIDAVFDKTHTSTNHDIWSDLNWHKAGDRRVINFHFGARRPACGDEYIKNGPDCHVEWKVSFTKSGYHGYSEEIGDTTPGGAYFNGEITFEEVELSPVIVRWTLEGSSSVRNNNTGEEGASIYGERGQTVTFTHKIKNNGPNSTSRNVNSAIVWGTNLFGYPGNTIVTPGGNVRSLGQIKKGATKTRTVPPLEPVTIPSTAAGGQQICQLTTFNNKYKYSNPSVWDGSSAQACVTVNRTYTLTPSASVSPTVIDSGESLSVTSSVNNSGPDTSVSTEWQLTRTVNGVQNPAGPIIPSGTATYPPFVSTPGPSYSDNDTNFPVGTRLCYILSVRPHSSSDPNWASSPANAACATIGKKPKVQVWGGDLNVRGNITTSTSVKNISGVNRTFGSWAEYGIVASGGIAGAASGAAYAGPGLANANSCTFSPLSFTNENCGTSSLGSYTSAALTPDVSSSFPSTALPSRGGLGGAVSPETLVSSGTYTAGNLTLNQSDLPRGKSIVIKSSGRVTINGNQTYSNGPYQNINQLPQLVIIANQIVINNGVDRVDAWLIASDRIQTCEAVGDRESRCNNQLTVNGPVVTNHLYLYRTAGSGNGAASGDPAEVFNLRGDAYLWALSQASSGSRIHSVYVTELPPRF